MERTLCKAVPLGLTAFLAYKIYGCPCDALLSCDKWVAIVPVFLAGMILFGFPLPK